MTPTVVLDEVHLTFRIPAALSRQQVRAIRRVLTGTAFNAAVHRAVLAVMGSRPALSPVRVSVGR